MNAKSYARCWILAATWLGPLTTLPYLHPSEDLPEFRCEAPAAAAQFVMDEITRAAGRPGVHAPKLAEQAAADIELARNWKPGVIGKASPRNAGGSMFGH